jgi:hypothetical protein
MNYATPLLDLSNLFGLEEGKIKLNFNFEGKYGFMAARFGTRFFTRILFRTRVTTKMPFFAKIRFRVNIFRILQIQHFRTELFLREKYFSCMTSRKIMLHNF